MNERTHLHRFRRDIALCLVLSAALILLVLVVSRNPDGYGAEFVVKTALLQTTPDPRIVFVGGSGTSFGIDSDVIQERTGLNPINLGLYVGFGVEYLLQQAASGLHNGDTVVLIPEYNALTTPPDSQGIYVLEEMQYDPTSVRFAFSDPTSLVNAAHDFPTWFSTRVYSTIGRTLEPVFPHSDTLYRRVYRKSKFNAFGDNDGALTEDYVLPASEMNETAAAGLRVPLNAESLARIDEFIAREERNGVTVYISWPALPKTLAAMAAPELRESERVMSDRFGAHILGTQSDFIFNDDSFFDSINHLRPDARTLRSVTLARLLTSRTRSTTERP